MKRTMVTLLLLVVSAAWVPAQQSVFVVRHAERADGGASSGQMMQQQDPELSNVGRARAQALAAMLEDAGIKAIFVTEYKRTQQTAEPLAKALGIEPVIVSSRDGAALIEKVNAQSGNVLVVGHSNTVGTTIAALGVVEPVKLEDDEYDNLFVVVRHDKPALVRLHFR